TANETLAKLDRWMEGLLPDAEVLELRRALLDEPELRALRDGMIAVRTMLARAIPALFSATPPLALAERLLDQAQQRQRTRAPRPRATRAQAILALAVLMLAAIIIVGPSLLAHTTTAPTAQAPAASELIDAAIHRFDRAPLQSGVLHEQYRVARGDQPAYLIE